MGRVMVDEHDRRVGGRRWYRVPATNATVILRMSTGRNLMVVCGSQTGSTEVPRRRTTALSPSRSALRAPRDSDVAARVAHEKLR